jgi:hypothetical protein
MNQRQFTSLFLMIVLAPHLSGSGALIGMGIVLLIHLLTVE